MKFHTTTLCSTGNMSHAFVQGIHVVCTACSSVIYAIWVTGSTAEGSQLRQPSFSSAVAPSATKRSRAVIHVGFRHPLWGLENVLYSRYCFRDVTVKLEARKKNILKPPGLAPAMKCQGYLDGCGRGQGFLPNICHHSWQTAVTGLRSFLVLGGFCCLLCAVGR